MNNTASPEQRIVGVFSTQEIRKVGTGTTTRRAVKKVFWFLEQDDAGLINCQALNSNYVPSGPKKIVPLDEVLNTFSPEPEFYMNSVYPKMQELERTVNNADAHIAKNETFSAEFEYDNALNIDEENIRANFGIGLTYLQRGETEKADNIFERLVNLEGAFNVEHKHLFNEFGISLRKNKLYTQAIEYYGRALELSTNDPNLYINIARVFLENAKYQECTAHLLKAYTLSPENPIILKFMLWMDKKDLIHKDHLPEISAILKDNSPE